MRQFLVEVFAPASMLEELREAERRARAATRYASRSDTRVRFLQAVYVPEDETCFYLFEAASAALVARATALAGLRDGRIVETFDANTHKKGRPR